MHIQHRQHHEWANDTHDSVKCSIEGCTAIRCNWCYAAYFSKDRVREHIVEQHFPNGRPTGV